jgi:ubiquinol-cytochrome c reductase cytochrome c subunit
MKHIRSPAQLVGRRITDVSQGAPKRGQGAPRRGPGSLRRLSAVYGGLLVVGSLAVAIFAGSVASAASPGPSAAAVITEAGRGGQLFLQSCANCHGPQGQGTSSGPDIRNAGEALADFMLRTGRMPMGDSGAPVHRSTPAFSAADQQALVAFVGSLGQGSLVGPGIPSVVTSGADLSAGRNLYVANCAACHGPAGGGGAVGGGFVAPNLTQADATTVGEAVVSGPGPMPRFSFTPDQLNQVAAYVQYLRTAPHPGGASSPEVGPVTEGFIAGLTLLALLVVARWVGVRGGQGRAPVPANDGAGSAGGDGDDGDARAAEARS